VQQRGACYSLEANDPAGSVEMEVQSPAVGFIIPDSSSPVSVSIRRFADTYPRSPMTAVAGGTSASIIFPESSDTTTHWRIKLPVRSRFTVCGLNKQQAR